MATTTYTHIRISVVDSNGDINVCYPQATAPDIQIVGTNTNLPTGSSTLQNIIDNLGGSAFMSYDSYLSNIASSLSSIDDDLDTISEKIDNLEVSSTDLSPIVQAVTNKGQTPASDSVQDIVTAIGNIEDADHGYRPLSSFSDSDLENLEDDTTILGTPININEETSREVNDNNYTLNHTHIYNCTITRVAIPQYDINEILSKSTISYDEMLFVLDTNDSTNRSGVVGKLVTGLNNSLYSVDTYRIIGKDHDGSSNTFDLFTEDCVQQTSNGFGSSNRQYDDSGCNARIFAEETFYNAFDSEVKAHIMPMDVKYYKNTSNGNSGTLVTLSNKYGKLLSYNEVGTIYTSATTGNEYYYDYSNDAKSSNANGFVTHYPYIDSANAEGTVYEYFDGYTSSNSWELAKKRHKKYNGSAVYWWLRSRGTYNADNVGGIYTTGRAYFNSYNATGYYLAPVLRIGNP